jgi:hypothetical protein
MNRVNGRIEDRMQIMRKRTKTTEVKTEVYECNRRLQSRFVTNIVASYFV